MASLPWLERHGWSAQNPTCAAPRRLVIVGSAYGQYPPAFFPRQAGLGYETPEYLQSLENLKSEFTVIQGLDHGLGGGHKGVSAWLTGMRYQPGAGNRMYSLDQFAADRIGQATRYSSIPLSLQSSESVSWNRNGVCMRSVGEPQALFDLLFRSNSVHERERNLRQVGSDQAILDVVNDSAQSLRATLGASDRIKFDEYLNAVHEIDLELNRSKEWADRPKPDPRSFGLESAPSYEALELEGGTRMATMRSMFDLMVLALQTDSTRVISLSIPGGNARFPIEGVDDGYHSLTHHGQDPIKIQQLKLIEGYYVSELARFLAKLKSIDEGEGTLLDHTIVLFGSGMGNASGHSNRNLPTLIAGGGLSHQGSLIFEADTTPLCNLFVTILQQLGIATDRFGTSTGALNELL